MSRDRIELIDVMDLRLAVMLGTRQRGGPRVLTLPRGMAVVDPAFLTALLDRYEETGAVMTGPFEVDADNLRNYVAGLPDDERTCPLCGEHMIEVVEGQKLTTADQATGTAQFLGKPVPVRDAVLVVCPGEDCNWGREATGNPPDQLAFTHAGLGYVDVEPPHAGGEV